MKTNHEMLSIIKLMRSKSYEQVKTIGDSTDAIERENAWTEYYILNLVKSILESEDTELLSKWIDATDNRIANYKMNREIIELAELIGIESKHTDRDTFIVDEKLMLKLKKRIKQLNNNKKGDIL